MQLSDDIRNLASGDADSSQIVEVAETALLSFNASGVERVYISPQEMAETCMDAICERMDNDKRHEKVLYTSFKKLNGITGGFEKGDLVIKKGKNEAKTYFVEDIDEFGILLVDGIQDMYYGEDELYKFYQQYRLLVKAKDLIEEE